MHGIYKLFGIAGTSLLLLALFLLAPDSDGPSKSAGKNRLTTQKVPSL
jgi:hypothetical protein